MLPLTCITRHRLPFDRNGRTRRVYDNWRLNDGTAVGLRQACPDDKSLIQDLMRQLSTESRYRRFFYPLHQLPPELLERFTRAEPMHAMSLLATVTEGGKERAIGMAQYVAEDYPARCDFAVVVADDRQGHGIATRLSKALVTIARDAGFARIEADVQKDNRPMCALMHALGFTLVRHPEDGLLRRACLQLGTGTRTAGVSSFVEQDR